MSPPEDYAQTIRQRYLTGDTPWDSGRPSTELIRALDAGLLPGKSAVELGCGTGTNAIELARRGYRVTAIDLADVAIERARAKAREAKVNVDFRVGDFTRQDLGGEFEVLFDSGVYHGIRTRDLPGFLRTVERSSLRGSRWLCLAGNAKEAGPNGPPGVREVEFRTELGPMFKFLDVREFRFDLTPVFQPLAWSILMERR